MVLVLELLILIGVVVGAITLVGWALRQIRESRRRRQPWHVVTDTLHRADGNFVVVEVCKHGEDTLEIKRLDAAATDFDSQLYLAQAEGRNVAMALNNRS